MNDNIGNAAALREALALCVEAMCRYCRAEARACGLPQCLDGCETLKMAKAALSAPARNCDCYDNEDEVESAYREFRQREVDKVPLDALDYSREIGKIPGKIKWLLAPVAERKGDGDE